MINGMWLWGAIGLVLLAVEMATGTFYVLWFGVAALIMGIVTWLMPDLGSATQLLLYSILSLGALYIWRTHYKKNDPNYRIGQSQGDEIGKVGTIIEPVSASKNGRIQFTQGVMGSREWVAVANEDIAIGTPASVVAVEGNALRVKSS